MLDAGNPRGMREYFKVDWLRVAPTRRSTRSWPRREGLPAPFGQLILAPMGGAVRRTDRDMALTFADAPWIYFCLAMWMDPAQDEREHRLGARLSRGDAAVRRRYGVLELHRARRGHARLRASFGEDKYARLVELKRRWDPDNVFRLNQNIVPASG